MKKLLLYGGTFDPPHSGHLHLLRQAARVQQFQKIIVMPTCLPPHKEAHHFLSDEKRLGAVRMVFSSVRGAEVSDYEIRKGGKSYTIDTVCYLKEQYPEYEIWLLMGSDMFLGFEKWYRFEELAGLCTLYVAARNKKDVSDLQPTAQRYRDQYGANSFVLHIPVHECSSTEIRGGASDERLPLEVQYYMYGDEALSSLKAYLKETLTPEKYEHSLRVAEYALHLAKVHHADEEKVYLAALLHDITKCWGKSRQLSYMQKKHYKLSSDDRQAPQIFHQLTGALYAAERYHIKDKVILNAIKCHTTCKEHMNDVDKILSLADSIEPSRVYDGVEDIRAVAETDLNRAVLMNLDHSIVYIIQKGFYLHPQTVAARNWLQKTMYLEEKHGRKQ